MSKADTVTLSRAEYGALLDRIEELEDNLIASAVLATEAALGAAAARRDYLSADGFERILAGEHPLKAWREWRGLSQTALARRASGPRWAPLVSGVIALDDDLGVRAGDRRIVLSPRQHALLGYLLRRRGEVVSRADVLREVFGYTRDPGTNVIDVHLAHLRRKLAGLPVAIATIRGVGFRLEVSER